MKNEINVLQLIIRVFVLDIWELFFYSRYLGTCFYKEMNKRLKLNTRKFELPSS
jgi:hypothetical protein